AAAGSTPRRTLAAGPPKDCRSRPRRVHKRGPKWVGVARILVVDNGGQWTHREWRVLKYLGVETEIVPRETPWEKLADADGLVLSGGAPNGVTLDTMGQNPAYLAKAPVPIL